MAGDDDEEDEAAEGTDAEDAAAEDEADVEEGGMVAPEGALPGHIDDMAEGDGGYGSEGSSMASAGLEDVASDFEISDDSELDEQDLAAASVADVEDPAGEVTKKAGGSSGGKMKAYHLSAEWAQLTALEQEKKVPLTRLPSVVGCGVHRHPAKCFWTASYPSTSIKSMSWGTTGKSPLECLVKCIKHVLKQHLIAEPHEAHVWNHQLKNLEELEMGDA